MVVSVTQLHMIAEIGLDSIRLKILVVVEDQVLPLAHIFLLIRLRISEQVPVIGRPANSSSRVLMIGIKVTFNQRIIGSIVIEY